MQKSSLKSYYEILQVEETASKARIKSQYRKLVRMYHPDVNSSLEAETIFKEINKAADILLDDEKRKNYDNLRTLNKKVYSSNTENSSFVTFSDLFKNTKKQKNKTPKKDRPKEKTGDDIELEVTITQTEAILGVHKVVNIVQSRLCPKCEGHKFVNGIKCPYCNGLGEEIQKRKITVKIPSMVKNNSKLRLKGEGQRGQNGGKNGNLYIKIKIEENSEFKIIDGVVHYSTYISPYRAILGGNIEVATLWGAATIKLPPLTKAKQSFKLVDVGILNEKTGKKGDEIVEVLIQIPSAPTPEEIELYQKLEDINSAKKNAKFI